MGLWATSKLVCAPGTFIIQSNRKTYYECTIDSHELREFSLMINPYTIS